MKVKKDNISLTVGTSKKPADIIVSLSIPFKGVANCCFKKLKNSCHDELGLMNGSEHAAVAYALYEHIRDKLAGSGLELFKNKVSNVDCNIIGDTITITWKTQGTGTSLRKTTGVVLSCLNPTKLFTKYSENIRFLSGKGGNKEEFNFVAKLLSESINKDINIVAVGKINTDTKKLEDIIDVIYQKLPEIEMPPAKECTAPAKKAMGEQYTYPIIASKGLESAIVADYIRNNSGGMSVGIIDDGVVIYNKQWETKHNQLKDSKRIKDYIEKKYGKLEDKDELSPIFAYFSLSQGFCNSIVAAQIIASKLKTEKLVELLKKSL